jgi:hypothetical protein
MPDQITRFRRCQTKSSDSTDAKPNNHSEYAKPSQQIQKMQNQITRFSEMPNQITRFCRCQSKLPDLYREMPDQITRFRRCQTKSSDSIDAKPNNHSEYAKASQQIQKMQNQITRFSEMPNQITRFSDMPNQITRFSEMPNQIAKFRRCCLAFGWQFCNWPLPITATKNNSKK